jgi:hypothetical protein
MIILPFPCRFSELERIVLDAQEEGADLIIGGKSWKHPYVEEGIYFEGTVVCNVTPRMEIAQQERACAHSLLYCLLLVLNKLLSPSMHTYVNLARAHDHCIMCF